jgi:hypothetical protein
MSKNLKDTDYKFKAPPRWRILLSLAIVTICVIIILPFYMIYELFKKD